MRQLPGFFHKKSRQALPTDFAQRWHRKQIAQPRVFLPRTVAEMFSPSPPRAHAWPRSSADLPPRSSQPAGSLRFFASATSIVGAYTITQFLPLGKWEFFFFAPGGGGFATAAQAHRADAGLIRPSPGGGAAGWDPVTPEASWLLPSIFRGLPSPGPSVFMGPPRPHTPGHFFHGEKVPKTPPGTPRTPFCPIGRQQKSPAQPLRRRVSAGSS